MSYLSCSEPSSTCLVVVDIQEKFRPVIEGFDAIIAGATKLIDGFRLLGASVIASEQYPKGLGATVEPVRSRLADCTVVEKTSFSCTGAPQFVDKIRQIDYKDMVICGVETHVCVNQTALSLRALGYNVQVAVDAVGSRKRIDHDSALRKMERAGVVLTTIEMCLFEMLGNAANPKFKEVQKLVK